MHVGKYTSLLWIFEFDPCFGHRIFSPTRWVIWLSLRINPVDIKTYGASARAQFRIRQVLEINTWSFQMDCQFSSALSWNYFWDSLCGVWCERVGELAASDVASAWMPWVRSWHCARKFIANSTFEFQLHLIFFYFIGLIFTILTPMHTNYNTILFPKK